jgi:hypothetical protein
MVSSVVAIRTLTTIRTTMGRLPKPSEAVCDQDDEHWFEQLSERAGPVWALGEC